MVIFLCAAALAESYESYDANIVFNDNYQKLIITGKIKNTGSKTLALGYESKLTILNNGEELVNTTDLYIYPKKIEAGKEGYFSSYISYNNLVDADKVKEAKNVKLDIKFRDPVEDSYIYKIELVTGKSEYYGAAVDTITATIENDSEVVQKDIEVAIIYKDKEGKLLFYNTYNAMFGLHPGSKLDYVAEFDEYKIKSLEEINFDIDIPNTIILAYSKGE